MLKVEGLQVWIGISFVAIRMSGRGVGAATRPRVGGRGLSLTGELDSGDASPTGARRRWSRTPTEGEPRGFGRGV